jgi:hypothetical protein
MARAHQDATSQPGGHPDSHPGDRMQQARPIPGRADASCRFDPSVPCPARACNAWLSGKDNFEPGRQAAREVLQHSPQVAGDALANRRFLGRAVRYLAAECGIRQFIDIGAGLPGPENTHEIAQQITPASQIVYAGNDPVVLAHARALLTSTPQGTCDYIDADLRDTAAILAGSARTLDLSRPAAVLLLAVLHFVPAADDPPGIVAALAAGLAPGSYIAISHLTADFAPATVAAGVNACNSLVPESITPRTCAQITGLFAGLPLVPPCVVPLTRWHPGTHDPRPPLCDLYAGLASTPGRRT